MIYTNQPPTVAPLTQSESGGPVTVSSSTSAGVPGSYVELIASTSFESIEVVVTVALKSLNTSVSAIQFDIATGAAASEVDQLKKIPFSGLASSTGVGQSRADGAVYSFSFKLASGSRLSVRIEDDQALAINYNIGIAILGE